MKQFLDLNPKFQDFLNEDSSEGNHREKEIFRETEIEQVTSWSYEEAFPQFEAIPISEAAMQTHMSNEKIGLVREFPFEAYCELNFRGKTSWGVKVPLTDILSFSSNVIKKPLLKMNSKYHKSARQTFKNILSYMKERSSSRPSIHHANKLLKIGMESPPEICDEIYCQLVKQTNNNPKIKSTLRAWTLFGICSGVFAPSPNLRLPLLNHLVKIVENESQEISSKTCYCITRLEKIYQNGSRLVHPTEMELKCMKAMRPIPIKVYLMSGSYICMLIESYDNSNDLKCAVLRRLDISVSKFSYFGFYEYCEASELEERYIEDCELILDIISKWNENENPEAFKLVLKIRVWYTPGPKDIGSLCLLHIQSVFDVISCKIPVSLKIALLLGALKLHIDMGNSKQLDAFLYQRLFNYIPERLIHLLAKEDWIAKLLQKRMSFDKYSKIEAQRKYLEVLSSEPLYGSNMFYLISYDLNEEITMLPYDVLLVINSNGAMIYTRDHREELLKFKYSEISSWGVSKDMFALIVAKGGAQTQYMFKTVLARVISSLMEAYVNKSLGRPIGQLPTQNTNLRKIGLQRELITKFPRLQAELFKM
ncbi:frmB [Blepharisma stoltei]|uniref:MyTH4 domain-containing protein n=1 Tax=Blepharisma stoltei TaxID=1481888 RepID=A0AAU9IVK8_9CILI|nr:unnamed protein product [Blepharisma stoltei]